MADQFSGGDGVPTWMVMLSSILGTVLTWKAWGPVGAWIAKRLDLNTQAHLAERTDYVARLVSELSAARDELAELRQDLGEEKELRMAMAIENAVQAERIDALTRTMAEDKRECQAAIRALRAQIQRLQPRQGQQP